MHCNTPVAGRTRSREALTKKQNLQNVNRSNTNDRVVSLSSDDEEEDGVEDEVQEESETSGSGSDYLDSGDDDDVLSDDSDEDDGAQILSEATEEMVNSEDSGNVERSEDISTRGMYEFEVRRRKAYGLDILIDENASQERKCAAQRTRSYFRSNRRNKKLKPGMGTISQPICLDEEEEQAESLSDSEKDDLVNSEGDNDNGSGRAHRINRKTKANKGGEKVSVSDDDEEEENSSACVQKGKKHINSRENFDVDKILRDSIYGKGDLPLEAGEKEQNLNTDLPLKFNFVTEESKPPEKSEYEKQLDELWVEMAICLHDGDHTAQVQNNTNPDDAQYATVEVDTATLCRQGKHHLILDEEIGLRCAYCLHVGLEIKYIVPPFSENPWGKSNRRDSCTVDYSVFNELQHQITGYDDYNLCNYTGTVWDIIPGVKKSMYPHQCEAFEFLWSHLSGGICLDKLKEQKDFPGGSGCIISHAPGTGKTRLTIVFLQSYMELYPTCRPMIIAPKGMLLTWEEEFKTWKVRVPFHNLNSSDYSGKESEAAMSLLRDSGRCVSSRVVKLYSWKCNKSILGVSYKLFEQLAGKGSDDKDLRKFLLEHPGLLVLDEGHTPRNSQSLIWKAVSEIRTKRRIILSGTPFQNNFHELYNTLCLASPMFAARNPSGGRMVFDQKQGHPRNERRGKWWHLTNSFRKVMDARKRYKMLNEIRNMIVPFVHVHRGTILQQSLPGLRKLVVILKPTQLQKELLEDIQKTRNVLKLEYWEAVTAVQPALFRESEGKVKSKRFRLSSEGGVKTEFLLELIRLSEFMNEKVLVFSQFISPLEYLKNRLKSHFSWTEGEVLQMHGKVDVKLRQASIKAFNDPTSKVRVMLASTKACYEGISLVGASRVVLLDVVWNPSVERQAISRAYRLGQKKFVYAYHLVTAGTRDEEKCSRQAEKDQLFELVFFNSEGALHRQNSSPAELEDKILEEMLQNDKFRHIFEKVSIKKQTLL